MWEYAEGPPVLHRKRQNRLVSAGGEQEELYTKSKAEWKLQGNYTRLSLLKET